MPCTGDADEICGGPNAINVYQYADYTLEGCFVDSSVARVLTADATANGAMSTDVRMNSLCRKRGSQFMHEYTPKTSFLYFIESTRRIIIARFDHLSSSCNADLDYRGAASIVHVVSVFRVWDGIYQSNDFLSLRTPRPHRLAFCVPFAVLRRILRWLPLVRNRVRR